MMGKLAWQQGMSSEAICNIKTVPKKETGLFPRKRPANKIGQRKKLQMNQKTGNAAPPTILHYKEDQPVSPEELQLKIENLNFICCIFTKTTEVILVSEQLIPLSFRLLEVLNQPQLNLNGFLQLFSLWKLLTFETYAN
ncbi:hypothetical protein ILYODFUR_039065 [Ilyodon furcidens]|uniref:Uncharacterized protein n=1 Tax=Ilyodon furcidens TaxID=33524 RepID=A0ABV0V1I9_9TELE